MDGPSNGFRGLEKQWRMEGLEVSIGHSLNSLRCQLGVLSDFAELFVGVLFPDGQEFGFLGSSCRG